MYNNIFSIRLWLSILMLATLLFVIRVYFIPSECEKIVLAYNLASKFRPDDDTPESFLEELIDIDMDYQGPYVMIEFFSNSNGGGYHELIFSTSLTGKPGDVFHIDTSASSLNMKYMKYIECWE